MEQEPSRNVYVGEIQDTKTVMLTLFFNKHSQEKTITRQVKTFTELLTQIGGCAAVASIVLNYVTSKFKFLLF